MADSVKSFSAAHAAYSPTIRKKEEPPKEDTPVKQSIPSNKPEVNNEPGQAPVNGLDPKALYDLGQLLQKGDKNKTPDKQDQGGNGGMMQSGDGRSSSGVSQSDGRDSTKKDDSTKDKNKDPDDKPIDMNSNMDTRLTYVMQHFDKFDTAAGIGSPDGKFSIKDLNALKDDKGEVGDIARGLIKDDVTGKLGGKDGKISIKDINNYQEDHPDGIVSNDFQQASEGNCVFLSTLRSGLATQEGQNVLNQTVTKSGNGWDVKFAGDDSGKPIHITDDDLKKDGKPFSKGDKDVQIINAAADQYFKAHGHENGVEGLGTKDAADLLFGKNAERQDDMNVQDHKPEEIKKFLLDNADNLGKGKDLSMVISGHANNDGTLDFTKGANHESTIYSIDKKDGTVTYINPWDNTKKHTISIDDLVKNMDPSINIATYKW